VEKEEKKLNRDDRLIASDKKKKSRLTTNHTEEGYTRGGKTKKNNQQQQKSENIGVEVRFKKKCPKKTGETARANPLLNRDVIGGTANPRNKKSSEARGRKKPPKEAQA